METTFTLNLFLLVQGHRFIFIGTRDKGLGGGKRYALRPQIIIIIIILLAQEIKVAIALVDFACCIPIHPIILAWSWLFVENCLSVITKIVFH